MTDLKFGVCLGDLLTPASECVRLGPKVEEWGYDSIWMCDHLIDIDGAVADPYAVFGYLAALTKRVSFCAAVSDCQRIHPSKMAHIIATLDEISGGRIALGIGAGEAMSTLPFGLPFEDDPAVRLQRLREYIQVVTALWSSSADSPVNFSGEHYTLDNAWIDQQTVTKPHPPIYVGALGSRAASRLTAEFGDGWMPFFSSPGYFKKRLDYIRGHAATCGRDPDAIEPTSWVYMVITDDAELAQKTLDDLAIFCLVERGSLKHEGFDLSQFPSKVYNFSRLVVSDSAPIEDLVKAASSVPTELVKKMHAVGTVDEMIDFFSAQIEAGAEHFIINPAASPNADETLELFATRVMPELKKL